MKKEIWKKRMEEERKWGRSDKKRRRRRTEKELILIVLETRDEVEVPFFPQIHSVDLSGLLLRTSNSPPSFLSISFTIQNSSISTPHPDFHHPKRKLII
jgi:hypothetical protein